MEFDDGLGAGSHPVDPEILSPGDHFHVTEPVMVLSACLAAACVLLPLLTKAVHAAGRLRCRGRCACGREVSWLPQPLNADQAHMTIGIACHVNNAAMHNS
eukprot:359839-Chlamydomonas_euryale.AAC.4